MSTAASEKAQRTVVEMPAQALPAAHEQGAMAEEGSIRDLSSFSDQTKALKNISLPLYDKQVTAFIGPSGCGKSTLLRVLNRIYDLYPKQRATGEGLLAGPNNISHKQDATLPL